MSLDPQKVAYDAGDWLGLDSTEHAAADAEGSAFEVTTWDVPTYIAMKGEPEISDEDAGEGQDHEEWLASIISMLGEGRTRSEYDTVVDEFASLAMSYGAWVVGFEPEG